MPSLSDTKGIRKARLGFRVERATANLPQTTAAAIFNIKTGRVLLTSIVGEVTTAIQAQANATKLVANPTTGTDVDICATVDINGKEVGTLYGITGTFATAAVAANAGATVAQSIPTVLPVGTLDLNCAASNTGRIKWVVTYVPLDDGAYMEAA